MTSLSLLLWIVSGIALQLAIFLGVSFWRHWLDYHALRSSVAELNIPLKHDVPEDTANAVIAAWQGFRTFRVDRKVIEDAVQSVCSFYLVPEDGQPLPPFLPGQFLTFRLDVPAATGNTEQITRCYSLSDAPRPDCYRVSIKRVLPPINSNFPPGRSSNFFHDQVVVGSLLQMRAPIGHFHIDRSDDPVVLIAGGIGITPMLSMLNWCLTEQPGREIWLFYGVRHGRELVMKSHLEALAAAYSNFHLRLCFSDPQPEDMGKHSHRGRVDVSLLRIQLPLKPYHFYICGPTPMLESIVPALEDWGVPDTHIHFEAFGPSSIKRKRPATTAVTKMLDIGAMETSIVVTFAKSGKQLPWQPAAGNLLEFAESNGISVDFGCRAGSCGTCQTTIRAGEVNYNHPPDYDPELGKCLLCVCTPKTSITVEA
ncbi:2Fe-2S iron-sulfur cluster-binding protein [Gallionella capsiferriformans]|uniref:Oxidoreductase FAD/NAD(P)-binding domain protein n=1 Tax=Gallionella capsiferriformans (strain ES-2) TaxID=395494 RepID=D9SEA4_GALCS|nr:2Fe-2S iron-sulfur cluster-binding protein [Gallionella capsiferriformans]ADL54880.1 oxidoreductase FAD/NAD(P)-binding domain protein [Gallionella capsiferriformans ES-2]MDZ7655182.1 2Fe-2S iron-sulfur cluster-binding protein [Sulfurimicrobium sp.]